MSNRSRWDQPFPRFPAEDDAAAKEWLSDEKNGDFSPWKGRMDGAAEVWVGLEELLSKVAQLKHKQTSQLRQDACQIILRPDIPKIPINNDDLQRIGQFSAGSIYRASSTEWKAHAIRWITGACIAMAPRSVYEWKTKIWEPTQLLLWNAFLCITVMDDNQPLPSLPLTMDCSADLREKKEICEDNVDLKVSPNLKHKNDGLPTYIIPLRQLLKEESTRQCSEGFRVHHTSFLKFKAMLSERVGKLNLDKGTDTLTWRDPYETFAKEEVIIDKAQFHIAVTTLWCQIRSGEAKGVDGLKVTLRRNALPIHAKKRKAESASIYEDP